MRKSGEPDIASCWTAKKTLVFKVFKKGMTLLCLKRVSGFTLSLLYGGPKSSTGEYEFT